MKRKKTDALRIDPQQRIAPIFDHTGIKLFYKADPENRETEVADDCAQAHIM